MRGRNIGWCEGSDRVPERPFVRVITVKPFAPLRGVILSQQVQQVLTHYIPNPARPNLFQTQPH